MKQGLIGWIFVILIGWVLFKSGLWEAEPTLLLPCALLAFLSCFPIVRWLKQGAVGIPIGETFCALHIVYYLIPMTEQRETIAIFPADTLFRALLAVCAFLGAVQVADLLVRRRETTIDKWLKILVQRRVSDRRELAIVWFLLGAWWCFGLATALQYLPDFGASLNTVRSVFTAGGMFAVVYLLHAVGRRALSPTATWVAILAIATRALLEVASGFLVGSGTVLATALVAFTMGRRKPPTLIALALALVLGFFHAGKGEFRKRYWAEDTMAMQERVNLVEAYSFWIESSWAALSSTGEDKTTVGGVLQRGSLLQMVALVVHETPVRLPYLQGSTYWQFAELIVPRVFWEGKRRGNLPTETLGIYYGVQTEESTDFTSISFGSIAEAWANFGWLGVILSGGIFGIGFSLARRVSSFANPNQPAFVLIAMLVPMAFNLEHTLAETLTMALQTLVAGGLLVVIFMRPRRFEFSDLPATPGSAGQAAPVGAGKG